MNTRTRRFILRLIVGLLTFVIGVAAAMLLGGFRPLQSLASSPNYRYREYHHHRSFSSPPSAFDPEMDRIYPSLPAKRGRAQLEELPPPPPPPAPLADAPMPPKAPFVLR